jgi:hypothetical protein
MTIQAWKALSRAFHSEAGTPYSYLYRRNDASLNGKWWKENRHEQMGERVSCWLLCRKVI